MGRTRPARDLYTLAIALPSALPGHLPRPFPQTSSCLKPSKASPTHVMGKGRVICQVDVRSRGRAPADATGINLRRSSGQRPNKYFGCRPFFFFFIFIVLARTTPAASTLGIIRPPDPANYLDLTSRSLRPRDPAVPLLLTLSVATHTLRMHFFRRRLSFLLSFLTNHPCKRGCPLVWPLISPATPPGVHPIARVNRK